MAINKLMSKGFNDARKKAGGVKGKTTVDKAIQEARNISSEANKRAGILESTKELKQLKKKKSEVQSVAIDIDKVSKESREFLSKMGLLVQNLASAAIETTKTVSKHAVTMVSEYTSAIKEDININKKNFFSMMFARSSPMLAFFVSKIFEMDIWKRMFSSAKDKASEWFSSIKSKFIRGKQEEEEEPEGGTQGFLKFSKRGRVREKRREIGGGLANSLKEAIGGEKEEPTEIDKIGEMKRQAENLNMHITANIVQITTQSIEGLKEQFTEKEKTSDIFQKFTEQFGQFTQKQEEQWTMFGYNVMGKKRRGVKLFDPTTWFSESRREERVPKKMGALKEFATLMAHEAFPMRRSFQDQLLLILYQLRDGLLGKGVKRVGFFDALGRSISYTIEKSVILKTIKESVLAAYDIAKITYKIATFPLKILFHRFGDKYRVKMGRNESPAHYTARVIGLMYSVGMHKMDVLTDYVKQIGDMLAEKFDKKGLTTKGREGWTLFEKGIGLAGKLWKVSFGRKGGKAKVLAKNPTEGLPQIKGNTPNQITASGVVKMADAQSRSLILLGGIYQIQEEEMERTKAKLRKEKGKSLWDKIKGFLLTGFMFIKNILSNLLGGVTKIFGGVLGKLGGGVLGGALKGIGGMLGGMLGGAGGGIGGLGGLGSALSGALPIVGAGALAAGTGYLAYKATRKVIDVVKERREGKEQEKATIEHNKKYEAIAKGKPMLRLLSSGAKKKYGAIDVWELNRLRDEGKLIYNKADKKSYLPNEIRAMKIKEKYEEVKDVASEVLGGAVETVKEGIKMVHITAKEVAGEMVAFMMEKDTKLKEALEQIGEKTGTTMKQVGDKVTQASVAAVTVQQNIASSVSQAVQQGAKTVHDEYLDQLVTRRGMEQ